MEACLHRGGRSAGRSIGLPGPRSVERPPPPRLDREGTREGEIKPRGLTAREKEKPCPMHNPVRAATRHRRPTQGRHPRESGDPVAEAASVHAGALACKPLSLPVSGSRRPCLLGPRFRGGDGSGLGDAMWAKPTARSPRPPSRWPRSSVRRPSPARPWPRRAPSSARGRGPARPGWPRPRGCASA